ncbi:MAG: tRNA (adenosine(37)-N6)-threonylcarbamoyltransferase complex ATPase subunit type 1 TsaE [Deltaproteobacteria bacterium]|nr:tRNA (adenosine(37)-N6)-threonylcarbamoyltransferase complex ATPase subunit type 1 TsaE [Deltaproteobacteria bacterium]
MITSNFSLLSHSAEETEQIAKALAKHLNAPIKIALDGDLGAGKTCFMRGLAGYFGAESEVSSPTYAIAHTYPTQPPIHHLDLYRVQNQDLEDLGVLSLVEDEQAIVCVEWSQNRPELREKLDIQIQFVIPAESHPGEGQGLDSGLRQNDNMGLDTNNTRQIEFSFSERFSKDRALTIERDLLSLFMNAG